jgi:ankyrin repeat protein
VEALIEGGANVNAQNSLTGASPLHMVVQSSKGSAEQTLAVTDALIQAGADLNLADNYGNLPAHHATSNPDADLSKALVKRLQPAASPLFQALTDCDLAAVEQLLSSSSNDDGSLLSTTYCGRTPLQVCVSDILIKVTESISSSDEESTRRTSQLVAILKALLAAGSDPNAGSAGSDDEEDEPPMHRVCCALRGAYKQGDKQGDKGLVVVYLLQVVAGLLLGAGAKVETATTQLLHEAARRNETAMARFLVETLHVDPNGPGRQGMTPLQFAARSGRMEILHYFLSLSNIDVQATDDRGQTALDAARVNSHEDAVAALEAYVLQNQQA